MKNNIPTWFWRLLPVLCGRQSAADFEQWLYGAENAFPENVYQGLMWLDYREVAENPLLMMDWISGEQLFDTYINHIMHGAIEYFQDHEQHRSQAWEYGDWLHQLPLPSDYIVELEDYFYKIAYENHMLNNMRDCMDNERIDLFLSVINAEQNRFLGKLCFALAQQTPPPPIPEILFEVQAA